MGLVAKQINKSFGDPPIQVLTDISLTITDGEFISLTGRSGSGKSTLLYLLSGLDGVTSGTMELSGRDMTKMDPEEVYRFRNTRMGFVFQFHYLIAELTALENVLMPARRTNQHLQRKKYAEELLERFELPGKKDRYPRQLSGGEQQRVAIARALVMEPEYLFADEPTGSLDSINGDTVMNIIAEENKKKKTTIVMVTHDEEYARRAGRQVKLVDGRIAAT